MVNRSSIKSDIDALISVRIDKLTINLVQKNPFCYNTQCRIQRFTKELKEKLSEEENQILQVLLVELELKNTVEGRYLYSQGMKDAMRISCFLDGEVLGGNFYRYDDNLDEF